jgi:hypothetical protein
MASLSQERVISREQKEGGKLSYVMDKAPALHSMVGVDPRSFKNIFIKMSKMSKMSEMRLV